MPTTTRITLYNNSINPCIYNGLSLTYERDEKYSCDQVTSDSESLDGLHEGKLSVYE